MIIAGFLLTLLLTFIVCVQVGRESPLSKEKPTWKRLVYWGGIFFISIVFNMLLAANNPYSYKISISVHDEGFYLFIWLILSYLVIQLFSPSIFFKRLYLSIKKTLEKAKPSPKDGSANTIPSQLEGSSQESNQNYQKEASERGFEIFLNTLCWLSFTFVILINFFYDFVPNLYDVKISFMKFEDIQEQLHHISSIMIFFTLPISFRQILFYLSKLRKPSKESKEAAERNSAMYERYVMVQRRLKGSNRKL